MPVDAQIRDLRELPARCSALNDNRPQENLLALCKEGDAVGEMTDRIEAMIESQDMQIKTLLHLLIDLKTAGDSGQVAEPSTPDMVAGGKGDGRVVETLRLAGIDARDLARSKRQAALRCEMVEKIRQRIDELNQSNRAAWEQYRTLAYCGQAA
jgi:hypothetical protein